MGGMERNGAANSVIWLREKCVVCLSLELQQIQALTHDVNTLRNTLRTLHNGRSWTHYNRSWSNTITSPAPTSEY